MTDIHIDFRSSAGRIKPLHGVNNGPVCYGSLVDVTHYYKESGIPYVRLHDTNWPHPREVDIYTIFPDFDKEPDDPASYDFSRTDAYIKSVIDTGAEIIYRLGVSIEHTEKKYYTHPPKDMEKWAKICIGIIKHYNQGWANGFYYGIKYWEIWNEPDNPDSHSMWSGTPEQYFELYRIAATRIKEFDSSLKVGGFAATMINPAFNGRFLEYCQKYHIPLDFFSWHTYAYNPVQIINNAVNVRNLLDQYGFESTESHLNEWNYTCNDPEIKAVFGEGNQFYTQRLYERMKSEEGASFDAAILILLQDCPVDIVNFYDAAPTSYWSLFNIYGVPQKNYHAFYAFNELYKHPERVKVELPSQIYGLCCCAGLNENGNEAAILISNFDAECYEHTISLDFLPVKETYLCETYMLDKKRDFELVCSEKIEPGIESIRKYMAKYSVMLLKLRSI